MAPLIDAHTHLDACGAQDADDVRAILDRAAAVGVGAVVTIADDLDSARWATQAADWDPRYNTLFETHDPGEPAHAGGTLYTRYGRGVYVFTAFSWFRQLPAGVPGAFRIFANLLSAGKVLP